MPEDFDSEEVVAAIKGWLDQGVDPDRLALILAYQSASIVVAHPDRDNFTKIMVLQVFNGYITDYVNTMLTHPVGWVN